MAADFLMRPEHEFSHVPDASPNFNESVFVSGFDMTTPVGGWMRLGNRANEGHAELSVCLYLPGGRIACQFQRVDIAGNGHFEAGGLSYEIVEPLKAVSMTFKGDLFVAKSADELRNPKAFFTGAPRLPGQVTMLMNGSSPVHGGEPANDLVETWFGRDFSLGHFNQHGTIKGSIAVGGESWEIDGRGWRDHSWGPRYWTAIWYHRFFSANFPNGDGFALLKIADHTGKVRRLGVLLIDGQYEEVADFDIWTEWTDQKEPGRVRLRVTTANRKAEIEGEIITPAPLRNSRKMEAETLVTRIVEAFTRFAWNGQVGHGLSEYIERDNKGTFVGYPL